LTSKRGKCLAFQNVRRQGVTADHVIADNKRRQIGPKHAELISVTKLLNR